MNRAEVIRRLGKISWNKEDWWLVAGGAMVLYGLRDSTRDLDLGCTAALCDRLEAEGHVPEITPDGRRKFALPGMDIGERFVFERVDTVAGIPVISVDGLLQMKRHLNRPKDQADIKRLEEAVREGLPDLSEENLSEARKMVLGLVYDPEVPEILTRQRPFQNRLWEFNRLKADDYEEKERYMREVFAECGKDCYIELPFHANFGGHHVHFGEHIYANSNLTLVDDGHIFVGDRVQFGPNVTVATAAHPIDAGKRARGLQYNRDVHIGDNAWIGAGVIILPGVHIGSNTVIGAGSVVTKDIPDGVVAVGNPCRVLRKAEERE